MTHEPTRGLTPRLRFPEFRDAGEWVGQSLGSIASFYKGKGISKADIAPKGETLCIRYGELYTIYDEVIDRVVSKTNLSVSELFLSQRNDVLIPSSGETKLDIAKASCVLLDDVALGGDLNILRTNENGIFLSYLLNGPYKREIAKKAQGDTVVHLYANQLKLLEVLIPKLSEQQRIADCLESLDELIAAHSAKLDALKAHKNGLLQQLFPAEGETVPRLRFPEFEGKGGWETRLIEDFFLVGSSKRVLQEDWTTQGVPFYRTRELVSLSKNEPFGSEIFISEDLFREISEKYGLPTEGDFLVSGVGTLGISYQVQAQDRFYFKDGNVLWFKLKGGIVSTFFKYCFETDEIQDQILGQSSISTVGTYTIQNAKATKFSCPPSIEEQQRIADCLAALDDRIAAQGQKLDVLKAHKKGLMQQLFPAVEP